MTEQYDPYENAMAERVNRPLKEEFSLGRTFFSSDQARRETRKSVSYYNSIRPHASRDYMIARRTVPYQAHQQSGPMKSGKEKKGNVMGKYKNQPMQCSYKWS